MLDKTCLKEHLHILRQMPQYKNLSEEQLSLMIDEGKITITEEELAQISLLYSNKPTDLDVFQKQERSTNTNKIIKIAGGAIAGGLLIGLGKRFNFLKHLKKLSNVSNESKLINKKNKQLKKIENTFERLKQKNKFELHSEKWSDKTKQELLEIASLNPKISEIILKRYNSISEISDIKKAAEIDSEITKTLLDLKYPKTLKNFLLREPDNYCHFSGQGFILKRCVESLKLAPYELKQFCNAKDFHKLMQASNIISLHGIEFLNKNLEELTLLEKNKLFHILLNERGVQNNEFINLSEQVKKLFPSFPNLKTNEYISTLKKLHTEIYAELKIPTQKLEQINTSLEKFLENNSSTNINNLAKHLTEIINSHFPDKLIIAEVQKQLTQLFKIGEFQNLSENEQKVCTLLEVLKNYSSAETPLLSIKLAKTLGLNEAEMKQLYNILNSKNLIKKLNGAEKKEFESICTRIAFDLKEGKNFDIANLVFNTESTNPERFNLIKSLVKEMQTEEFLLPQTTKSNYIEKAVKTTCSLEEEQYNLNVVRLSSLESFNSYCHSLRGSSSAGQSLIPLEQVLEKYTMFGNITSENVFCTSFITKDALGILDKGIGLLFEVPKDCQYVGAGYDICSVTKQTKYLLEEYFSKNTPIQTQLAWGMHKDMTGHELRRIVSDNLKKLMDISDFEYAEKIKNLKSKLGNNQLTPETLEKIDFELAQAYKKLLSRANNAQEFSDECILRNPLKQDYRKTVWNEFLISQPKISGIYINANSIEELSPRGDLKTYLKFAEEHNIPIVLLKA